LTHADEHDRFMSNVDARAVDALTNLRQTHLSDFRRSVD